MPAESPRQEADGSTDASDKDFSCPSCDRSFSTEGGMKSHHAQIHGESIAGVQTKCEFCGDTYRTAKSNVERNRFCSKECLYNHRSTVTGEDHELYERVTTSCSYCGKEQQRHPYELDQSDHVFCDTNCKAKWWSDNIVAEQHPKWVDNTEIFECEQCGKEYEYEEGQADRTRFCSQDCLTNWQSENLSGKNSVHYKGDYEHSYGPNWPTQRDKALRRDQYRCQRCLKSESELNQKPDVHHLKRINSFKDEYESPEWYERGNRLDNLVCLCRSCHGKWEGIPLRPQ